MQLHAERNQGARGIREDAPETPPAPAAPSVRRLARELGVEINDVPGTEPGGRISVDDVKAYVKRLVAAGTGWTGEAHSGEPLPDFAQRRLI